MKRYFFDQIENLKKTWTCFADEPDRQVYTKQEEGSGVMSVFFRFKVPVNMIKPLGLLSEVDLFKEWMPGMLRSDIEKDLSPFRKVLYV
jgi:hypothetical protein